MGRAIAKPITAFTQNRQRQKPTAVFVACDL